MDASKDDEKKVQTPIEKDPDNSGKAGSDGEALEDGRDELEKKDGSI